MSAVVVMLDRFAATRRSAPPAAGVDVAEVERQVRAYAFRIGCNESNRMAAVATALKWGNNTEQAIAEGKKRADKLRSMQPDLDGAA